ncbi:MAG TPA: hypothetical protein VIR01_02850 [Pyrinomonadaceae bacterium]
MKLRSYYRFRLSNNLLRDEFVDQLIEIEPATTFPMRITEVSEVARLLDVLIARAEALKDTSFPDAVVTKTSKRQRPRVVAQSASVATKRKSGVVKRRTQSKKAKSKRR